MALSLGLFTLQVLFIPTKESSLRARRTFLPFYQKKKKKEINQNCTVPFLKSSLWIHGRWRRKWQPVPYSCWENPMDRGAWQAIVHGVANSQTWLITWIDHFRLDLKIWQICIFLSNLEMNLVGFFFFGCSCVFYSKKWLISFIFLTLTHLSYYMCLDQLGILVWYSKFKYIAHLSIFILVRIKALNWGDEEVWIKYWGRGQYFSLLVRLNKTSLDLGLF